MSNKFKYVFLLLGLFLSFLFFATGVHSISYADERIDNKQTLQEESKTEFIELSLPQRSTRSLNQFQQYYSDITSNDLIGSQVYLTFLNCQNRNDVEDYINNYFNVTISLNSYYTYEILNDCALSMYNNTLSNDFYKYVTLYNIRFGNFSDRLFVEFNSVAYFNQSNNMYIGYTYSLNYYSDRVESNSTGNIFDCTFFVSDIYNNNLLNNVNIVSNYNLLSYNLLNYKLIFIDLLENDTNIIIDYPLIFDNVYNNNNTISQFITGFDYYFSSEINYPITVSTSETLQNEIISYSTFSVNTIINIPDNFNSGYCIIYLKYDFNYIKYSSPYTIVSKIGKVIPLIVRHYNLPVPLSTPVLTVSNNILTWSDVSNADYYIIKRVSDNQTFYVNNYTSLSYVLSVNGFYSVQACSNQSGFLNSDFSNVIIITSFADTEYSFLLLMSAIMDSILMLFKSFLNYEIFGVNMFSAFGVILFICLILALLRVIRGNK